jgi:hypothetical protein
MSIALEMCPWVDEFRDNTLLRVYGGKEANQEKALGDEVNDNNLKNVISLV